MEVSTGGLTRHLCISQDGLLIENRIFQGWLINATSIHLRISLIGSDHSSSSSSYLWNSSGGELFLIAYRSSLLSSSARNTVQLLLRITSKSSSGRITAWGSPFLLILTTSATSSRSHAAIPVEWAIFRCQMAGITEWVAWFVSLTCGGIAFIFPIRPKPPLVQFKEHTGRINKLKTCSGDLFPVENIPNAARSIGKNIRFTLLLSCT